MRRFLSGALLAILAILAIAGCSELESSLERGSVSAEQQLAQPACEWVEVEAQDIAEHHSYTHVFECESGGTRCLLVLAANSSSMKCFSTGTPQLEGE